MPSIASVEMTCGLFYKAKSIFKQLLSVLVIGGFAYIISPINNFGD